MTGGSDNVGDAKNFTLGEYSKYFDMFLNDPILKSIVGGQGYKSPMSEANWRYTKGTQILQDNAWLQDPTKMGQMGELLGIAAPSDLKQGTPTFNKYQADLIKAIGDKAGTGKFETPWGETLTPQKFSDDYSTYLGRLPQNQPYDMPDYIGQARSQALTAADTQAQNIQGGLSARGGGQLGTAFDLGAKARVGAEASGIAQGQQLLLNALGAKYNILTALLGQQTSYMGNYTNAAAQMSMAPWQAMGNLGGQAAGGYLSTL